MGEKKGQIGDPITEGMGGRLKGFWRLKKKEERPSDKLVNWFHDDLVPRRSETIARGKNLSAQQHLEGGGGMKHRPKRDHQGLEGGVLVNLRKNGREVHSCFHGI